MPYKSPFQSNASSQPNTLEDNAHSKITQAYFHNASSPRVRADIYMYNAICAAHPGLEVINTAVRMIDIIGYMAQTGDGSFTDLSECSSEPDLHVNSVPSRSSSGTKPAFSSLNWTEYLAPYQRLGGGSGSIATVPVYGKYLVKWAGHEFLLYIIETSEGNYPAYELKRQYIVTSDKSVVYSLIKTVGTYSNVLHNEIWVFDQGYWQKDAALFEAIQKSRWEDIVLPESLKEDLLGTIQRFYDSSEIYRKLHVPWKRGLIFYGPPGNGKTVSVKATMKTLYDRKDSVPTMYVKSFVSYAGPEYSISLIFEKARQQAPCYLVFEDLDSLVTDEVRSFFLNAVDGLSSNDGILMVGSTNHLDRLDPGIAKRPSRFDRKYLFPNPDMEQRVAYCKFWQRKLKDNDDVEFPDKLLRPIAGLTDEFSFAYMQEAFVSTLLKIASEHGSSGQEGNNSDLCELEDEIEIIEKDEAEEELVIVNKDGDNDKLDRYVLWREIKVQIANLRKELDKGDT